jgi:glucokinase
LTELVAVDVGGTHARFAIGVVAGGRVVSLGEPVTLKTGEHASLQLAWNAFGERIGRALPNAAAIALAGPVKGEVLKLTNNPWMISASLIRHELGVGELIFVNDFGAVAHAVAHLAPEHFSHVCGSRDKLPDEGAVTIIGPGTGLGVAQLIRSRDGYRVVETEGGHLDFAPLDGFEDQLLTKLRARYRRVSVERLASGPGLSNIHEAIAQLESRANTYPDEAALWAAAMSRDDPLAAAALDRFCLILGAVAGDIALAQGAGAVVIAGGLGLRLARHLPASGFRDRFIAKGRFERMMADMPVKLITHPQPGLFGAAAAFANRPA